MKLFLCLFKIGVFTNFFGVTFGTSEYSDIELVTGKLIWRNFFNKVVPRICMSMIFWNIMIQLSFPSGKLIWRMLKALPINFTTPVALVEQVGTAIMMAQKRTTEMVNQFNFWITITFWWHSQGFSRFYQDNIGRKRKGHFSIWKLPSKRRGQISFQWSRNSWGCSQDRKDVQPPVF